jgi:type IV pilus assembly protein PilW
VKRQQKFLRAGFGFTLVELLIAMTIGLTLSAGVIQVYVTISQTDRVQEARMRMQETGRFAINLLTSEIRMAGHFGCLSAVETDDINNILHQPPSSFQAARGIQGWEAKQISGTQGLVSSSEGGWISTEANVLDVTMAMTGTDIFRVWSASSGGAMINSISAGAAVTAVSSAITDLRDGDIIVLNDCQNVDLLQACSVSDSSQGISVNYELRSSCNPGNDVRKSVLSRTDGELLKLQGSIFYIGKRANAAENPPALFRRQLNSNAIAGTPEEMLEGIENMQILYGVNLDNNLQNPVVAYLPADQVPAWSTVISLRLNLLVQSIDDNLAVSPQPYVFDGVVYDGSAGNGSLPRDRRLRSAFTATVALRNRVLQPESNDLQ